MKKKVLAWLLTLSMILTAATPALAADTVAAVPKTDETVAEPVRPQNPTTIMGLQTTITKQVSSTAVIENPITIAPVRACSVELQYFHKDTEQWKTDSAYEVKAGSSGSVKLKYSSRWKNVGTSRWRVVIPAGGGCEEYISETITITSKAPSSSKLKLGCRGAVILRASDGFVVYGKNKDKRLANASTTKMMTALLTLEKGGLGETTRISKKAARTGYACLHASAGTRFRVKDLLSVMLVHSSNDAASTLAEWNAGSIGAFAKKMTTRAKELGCLNTSFKNPHGLPNKKHYSSAYDLALIQRECIKYPTYLNIVKKKKYSFSSVGKRKRKYTFYTTDKLLGKTAGFLGGKTGYTSKARQCFCGVFECNGETYIYTVLGNPTSGGRWQDCRKIMTFIKDNYQ